MLPTYIAMKKNEQDNRQRGCSASLHLRREQIQCSGNIDPGPCTWRIVYQSGRISIALRHFEKESALYKFSAANTIYPLVLNKQKFAPAILNDV
jgi:hypothetical protein